MNSKSIKFFCVAAFILSGVGSAQAIECQDPAWTKAISEAMGRAPKAGECNPHLYGAAGTHEDKVRVAKEVLGQIYQRRGTSDVPTQQLPLTASRAR